MLPAQEPHLSGVRDAGAEPLRLPQTEQVQSVAAEIHQAHPTAGAHGIAQTKGELLVSLS